MLFYIPWYFLEYLMGSIGGVTFERWNACMDGGYKIVVHRWAALCIWGLKDISTDNNKQLHIVLSRILALHQLCCLEVETVLQA